VGWYELDWSSSGQGSVEGSYENGNKLSGFVKCWEILEWLQNWRPLEKSSAPWS
jgi:hypothetical protein